MCSHARAFTQPLHVTLALHLLFELGNSAAPGHAYVATLPTPDAPSLWPAASLAALAGTRTHAAAASRRAFVTATHAALFGGAPGIPLERFSWALAVILSRALSGDGGPYTLVPVLDALNHAAEPSCACVRRRVLHCVLRRARGDAACFLPAFSAGTRTMLARASSWSRRCARTRRASSCLSRTERTRATTGCCGCTVRASLYNL
jgi:hypothetical protein